MASAITTEVAIEILKTGDVQKFGDMIRFFESASKQDPESINHIATSHEFLEAVTEAMTNTNSEELLVLLFRLIESFFPIIPKEKKIEFVDTGFEFVLIQAMDSTNHQFITDTI